MCYMINTNDLYCNIQNNHLENSALTSIEPIEIINNIDTEYIRIFQEIQFIEKCKNYEYILYVSFWLCVFYMCILELIHNRNINTNDLTM